MKKPGALVDVVEARTLLWLAHLESGGSAWGHELSALPVCISSWLAMCRRGSPPATWYPAIHVSSPRGGSTFGGSVFSVVVFQPAVIEGLA